MKLSRTVVFAVFLSTLSQQARPADIRSAVMLRLDRTDATDSASSDKGSQLIIAELDRAIENYSTQVSRLRNGAPPEAVSVVKSSLDDIFELMPRTNRAFNRIIEAQSKTAPLLVDGLRKTIKRALNISATRSELRVRALDLLIERMELHAALASGPNGSQFLSTFSIWLAEISGWRYRGSARSSISVTPAERQRIARSEYLYRKGFSAMMCSKLFSTAPPVGPKSR